MSGWLDAVCRAGVFIICAQVLVQCRPDSSYEKYLKMLVSVMILMQLFLPFSHFFAEMGDEDMQESMTWFQMQLQEMEERNVVITQKGKPAGEGDAGRETRQELAPETAQEEAQVGAPGEAQGQKTGQEIHVEAIGGIDEIDRVEIKPILSGGEGQSEAD